MHVGFVVDKVTLVFFLVVWFSPVGVVPQVLCSPVSFLHLQLTALLNKTHLSLSLSGGQKEEGKKVI
jgi:hypothetical protein